MSEVSGIKLEAPRSLESVEQLSEKFSEVSVGEKKTEENESKEEKTVEKESKEEKTEENKSKEEEKKSAELQLYHVCKGCY